MISLISPSEVKNPTSIAIGSFDGLHAGHRKLIESVIEENQYTPTIASFWPHPREILYKETRLRLDLPEEKLPILEDLGIEQLVLIPFDKKLSNLSAESFVRDILINQLQAKNIFVGANFKFGYRRSGDVNTIKNTIKNMDIKLKITPILEDNEGRISSSRIRDLLLNGDLKNAYKILNRPYSFNGNVVRGKGIGKRIGWPTANLEIDGRKFLPGEGVYAAWTIIENSNQKIPSVMNLGSQPTINPLLPSAVEVHLINKNMNLYGLNLSVEPVEKLRSQIQFQNVDQLSNQIKEDRDYALKVFKNHKK
ncbi:FMN adenylyltransferase / riboflavin kinase [Prochlorococcus marinus str. MIT 9312]|uniref:Riboflavin biosynthesis protein n=1 Tax=Prochlorococcus marinus (strain MIT 9312) TaxID=74546 RepID=Q319L8_PROM9|nr:bifunctional riboflavin kinase/FAD synthetase [Prochlorococcus marinus]ABB50427.1 FMN adenylyltransferase / riboflavin kinase [Prochlorococcus marinus str. MIT 9312]KGF99774.1 Riboflavin kinase [Prochlorococcus marinus str. MIT 9311]